LKGSRPDR